ncbi:MAG: DMT family transporter [Cyanobacteria bacterium P01_H01_bin.121]
MEHRRLAQLQPVLQLLLIAPFFLWGTAMVAMKGTIAHTTPFFLATVRLLPAGGLVLLAAAWLGRPQPKGWQAWAWITAFALVDGTLFQGFLATGLARTDAGLGSVMIDSQPLAVALLALILFGDRIWIWGWLGLGLGIIGISLLGFSDHWFLAVIQHWQPTLVAPLQSLQLLPVIEPIPAFTTPGLSLNGVINGVQSLFENGQWLMLLAALSMAIGTILSRYTSRHVDPITATGWHMIIGSLPLLLCTTLWEHDQWTQLVLADYAALAYATIFGSAIAYGLFFYFAARGSLTSLSALTFLTPVFALLFGHLFLQEVLPPLKWLGVGITLFSVYLINQRQALQQWWQAVQQADGPELKQSLLKLDALQKAGQATSQESTESTTIGSQR